VLTHVVVTTARVIVLRLPKLGFWDRRRLRHDPAPKAQQLLAEAAGWHLILNSELAKITEPSLGKIETKAPQLLLTRRALFVEGKGYAIGEGPGLEEMLGRIRHQWTALRPISRARGS
jgi:hypothetical protein